MTSPAGATLYSYDKAGRLVSLTSPYGEVTSWTYDHIGRVLSETTTTTANHTLRTDYSWGVSGQSGDPSTAPCYLRTITQTLDGQPFYGYTLTHSYLGQLQQQTGSGGGTSETQSYQFDNRGRLTSENNQFSTGGQNYTSVGGYSYDLANNLMGGVNGWTYDSDNQVTASGPVGNLTGATGLSYDAAGNLTAANGMTFGWDVYGQLTSVTGGPGGNVSFVYDALGRRLSKTALGQTVTYVYDGPRLVCEMDANGNVLRSYNWGATGLISDHGGALNQSSYSFFDGQGNRRAVLDPFGVIRTRSDYSSWGAPLASGLSPASAFGWKGRFGAYQDGETGLVQMGARYYAPALGRFISRDPNGGVEHRHGPTHLMNMRCSIARMTTHEGMRTMESKAKFAGHPIHPMLIVFPLGLLTTSVIFDILALSTHNGKWSEIAFYMIAAGVIGGLVAAVFGFVDWLAIPANTRAKTVGLWHGVGNVVVVGLFIVSWFLRRDDPANPAMGAVALSIAAVVLACVTGWLGGELVDRLGVGVDPRAHLNAPGSLSGRPAVEDTPREERPDLRRAG